MSTKPKSEQPATSWDNSDKLVLDKAREPGMVYPTCEYLVELQPEGNEILQDWLNERGAQGWRLMFPVLYRRDQHFVFIREPIAAASGSPAIGEEMA